MTTTEQFFFWATVLAYAGGSLFYIYSFVFNKTSVLRWAGISVYTGLVVNIATIAVRIASSGHLPVGSIYENNLVLTTMTAAIFIWWQKKIKSGAAVGMICLPFAFILLGFGYISSPRIEPLTAAYMSPWLVVHVIFALLGTACFVFALGTSIFYLLKSRYADEKIPDRYTSMPSPEALNDLSFRVVLFGFIAWTVMIITGAIWAKALWGSYWSWDSVETWSLISWLAYGIYIHLYFTYAGRGKLLAWICIAGFLINIISMWAVGLVTPATYHNLQQITTPLNK